MSEQLHSPSLRERWPSLSLAQQLCEVGSEVNLAIKWRPSSLKIAEEALRQAIELIDLTLADPRHRTSVSRLREICLVQEILLDFMDGPNLYFSTEATLRSYFDAVAVAAANERAVGR